MLYHAFFSFLTQARMVPFGITKPSLKHKGHLASLVDWLLFSISANMERLATHKSYADAQGLYLPWLSLCHRLSGPEIITDESFGHQAQHFVDSYL